MAKSKKTKETVDNSNQPWVANYPPLREWLEKHDARCMWQAPREPKPEGDDNWNWSPRAYIECWMIGTRLAIIVIHADKHGWEIYTPCDSPKVDATLVDAEKRLGLGVVEST